MSSKFVPSKYTAVIHNLREQGFDFGLNDYPIFDESYREKLNKKILDHYDFYEIGQETPYLFKLFLNRTMEEIMPYYNEIYKSIINYSENLLKNVDLQETLSRDTTSEITGNSSSESNSQSNSTSESTDKYTSIFNNTPQGQILKNAIEEQDYATTLTQNKDENSSSQNSNISDNTTNQTSQNGSGTENYKKNITGNNGVYLITDIIEKFRKNIVNVDLMIIEDTRIKELFFGLN